MRLLQSGRVKDGYERKIKAIHTRRENKRKMNGDGRGDWLPHRAEERVEGDEAEVVSNLRPGSTSQTGVNNVNTHYKRNYVHMK